MFKIFLSCSHKKPPRRESGGDARRAGVGGFFIAFIAVRTGGNGALPGGALFL